MEPLKCFMKFKMATQGDAMVLFKQQGLKGSVVTNIYFSFIQ